MNILKKATLVGALSAFSIGTLAFNNQTYSPESEILLKQLEGHIVNTLRAVSANEEKAGRDISNFRYQFSSAQQTVTNLGLIVDNTDFQQGLTVLSVTPGGLAEGLAIKPNDNILSVNNIELKNLDSDYPIGSLFDLSPGDSLQMMVGSGDNNRVVNTVVNGQTIPSIQLTVGDSNFVASAESETNQCGRVSVSLIPPLSKDLHKAFFHKINDNHRLRDRPFVKLSPGKHTILLHELIKEQKRNYRKAKSIEIDVKPNTIYHLAAEFHREKRLSSTKGEYWDPVVWKVSEKKCEFN